MTGIAAVFHRDGRPADPRSVERMLAAAPYRGAERHCHVDGAVAIGATARASMSCHNGVALVFDGRIDNRDELLDLLPPAMFGRALSTDADLALAAYVRWGDAGADKLLGDFAFVIWDAPQRRVVCARDIIGIKPLYYYCDGNLFVCASEPQQVLAAVPRTLDVNEAMVAEHLSLRVMHQTETLFTDLCHVPAANVLSVTGGTFAMRRYYDPPTRTEIRYRTDAEYADHFRELLIDAIRCRLDGDRPFAAYLSGGLDSSTLVGLIEQARRRGAMPDAQMETVTMVAPGRPSDETSYARDVVRLWDLRSHEIDTRADDAQVFVDHVAHYRDAPLGPNVIAADRLVERVRDTGCRVVLTGMGGDDWLCAAWIHIPELLARGRVREFFDVLRWENEQEFRTGWLKPVLVRGVWPLLPLAMQTLVNRARGRTASPVPDPLTPEFAAATRVGERTALPTGKACATRSRQELYNWLFDGRLTYVMDLEDRHHAGFGVEARHPFHDRRVIEFLMAIPEDQRWRSTETKFILRTAAAGVLPDSVRTRVTKGDYSHAFIQAFDAFGGEACFASLEAAKRGWVDHDAVRQRYLRMRAAYDRGDESYSLDTRCLWAVFGIELWLRYGRLTPGAPSSIFYETPKELQP